jgi:hypothetical protein
MKTTIVKGGSQPMKEIDWSKKQIVELMDDRGHTVVVTSGKHSGRNFSGYPLFSSDQDNVQDGFSDNWLKHLFKLITEPITITFEND